MAVLQETVVGGVPVLALSGVLDQAGVGALEPRVEAIVRRTGAATVIADLSGVAALGTSGISMLLAAHRVLGRAGGRLVLIGTPRLLRRGAAPLPSRTSSSTSNPTCPPPSPPAPPPRTAAIRRDSRRRQPELERGVRLLAHGDQDDRRPGRRHGAIQAAIEDVNLRCSVRSAALSSRGATATRDPRTAGCFSPPRDGSGRYRSPPDDTLRVEWTCSIVTAAAADHDAAAASAIRLTNALRPSAGPARRTGRRRTASSSVP